MYPECERAFVRRPQYLVPGEVWCKGDPEQRRRGPYDFIETKCDSPYTHRFNSQLQMKIQMAFYRERKSVCRRLSRVDHQTKT